MVEAALDPSVGGPSEQFLLAAKAAGVDLEDEQALRTFIKGWNARSELDLADLEVPQAIEPDEILQLKITLKGISKPPVRRRVQVRPTPPSRCSTRSSRRRSAGPTRTCTASSTTASRSASRTPSGTTIAPTRPRQRSTRCCSARRIASAIPTTSAITGSTT